MVYKKRVFSAILAVLLVFSLAFVPAMQVQAEEASGASVEVNLGGSGVNLSFKAYADEENALFALMMNLSSKGKNIADAGLYLSQGSLILESKSLLGKAYGVSLLTLPEQLPDSLFAPDSGSRYALPQEAYDAVMQVFTQAPIAAVPAIPQQPTLTAEQEQMVLEAVEKYTEVVTKLLTDNAEVGMRPETVTVGTQEIPTSKMTLKLDAQALSTIVSSLLKEASGDASLQELFALFYEIGTQNADPQVAAQLEGTTGAEAAEQLWTRLPEMAEQATANILEKGLSASLVVNLSKATNSPIVLAAEFTSGSSSAGVRYTMGESFETSEAISLEFLENGKTAAAIVYEVAQNDEEAYSGFITMKENGDDILVISLVADKAEQHYSVSEALNDGSFYSFTLDILEDNDETLSFRFTSQVANVYQEDVALIQLGFAWNKLENRFILAVDDNGQKDSISGVVTTEGDTTTIQVEQSHGSPFSVILRSADSLTAPDFVDIFTLSETELTQVLSSFLLLANMVGRAM